MDNYIVSRADMVSLADTIRAKGGMTGALVFPNGWRTAIEAIKTGGSTHPLGEKLYSFGVLSDIHIQTATDSAADTGHI